MYCVQEMPKFTEKTITTVPSNLEMNYAIILENEKGRFMPIEDSEAINQFRTLSFLDVEGNIFSIGQADNKLHSGQQIQTYIERGIRS